MISKITQVPGYPHTQDCICEVRPVEGQYTGGTLTDMCCSASIEMV
jgi:hypothetical protein